MTQSAWEGMSVTTTERDFRETDDKARLFTYLKRSVFDARPRFEGDMKDCHSLGDAMLGALNAEVNRADPPLEMPRITIRGGESIALIGRNGSGKSTFCDSWMERGNAHFSKGSHGYHEGIHQSDRLRIARLNQEELFDGIGDLPVQKILDATLKKNKEDFLVDWEDMDRYDQNLRNQEAQQRCEELLSRMRDLFEINQFTGRNVRELSGGERTKLALAILLASEPDVMFLDEPTNHLDLESIAKLTGLLEIYKRAGVGVVSASHVEWFLEMAGQDGTIELQLKEGKRIATQSKSSYRDFVKKEATKSPLEKAIQWDNDYTYPHMGTMLCSTLSKISLPDSPLINTEIPTLNAGEITVLSGKNGTGKTKFMEELVKKKSKVIPKEKGVQMAYLPQFWPDHVARGTVEGFFLWVRETTNSHSDRASSRFSKELRDLGFKCGKRTVLNEPLASFSGGEQRLMWFVAASVIEGTDVLVLDEPTNHMDRASMFAIAQAIKSFPGGVVLSTHDLRLMEELSGNMPGSDHSINNLIFERGDQGHTKVTVSKVNPKEYAGQVISKAKQSARRVQIQ